MNFYVFFNKKFAEEKNSSFKLSFVDSLKKERQSEEINIQINDLMMKKDYIHRYFESKNDSKSSASFMSGQKYTSSRTTSLVSYDKIFAMIDKDKNGYIESEEAGKILLRLNSRFRRSYGEDELTQLFATLDKNGDGKLNEEEFKTAFEQL